MTGLRTSYEFTLPRGYVDHTGQLHTDGTMRLATARDELDPLRDPTISGPEDPRLTILVLARVITRLGSMELVTDHDIENLFAVDLAFLQDFYGVINFGTQADYEELMRSQAETSLVGGGGAPAGRPAPAAEPEPPAEEEPEPDAPPAARPPIRAAIEEIRRESS
ncbi:hypothetical protein [Jatrophihabitans fulvus]